MAVASRIATKAVWTPANVVTMTRMVLAPIVVAVIYLYAPAWWVLVFGFLSMITDKIDGYLARRYGVTELGAFLDPLADKFMVLGSLAVLVIEGWIWWVPAAIIAAREIAMSSWRSRLARQGVPIPATRRLAKYKTWVQSIAVALALTPGVVDNHRWLLTSVLWFAVALTVYTFVQYVRDGSRPEQIQA